MPRLKFSRLWIALLISGCFMFGMLRAQPEDIWGEFNLGYIGSSIKAPTNSLYRAGVDKAIAEAEIKYKLDITLIDKTARQADFKLQIEAIKELYVQEISGLLLTPCEGPALAESINFLSKQEIPTITIGEDSPGSERLMTVLMDDEASGRLAMEACIESLGNRGGDIAILAGNVENPQSQKRLLGALAALEATVSDKVRLASVYHCAGEDLNDALSTLQLALKEDRDQIIDAWVLLDSWTLNGAIPLPWSENIKRIRSTTAIGALSPALPYLERNEVDALIGQSYFNWGYRAAWSLIEKVHKQTEPVEAVVLGEPVLVTSKNVKKHWQTWARWQK